MKLFLTIALCVSVYAATAQRHPAIDSGNYYAYYRADMEGLTGNSLSTAWISQELAAKVIGEELKKAGYGWLYDNWLYASPDGQKLLLTNYCKKDNFGFVYIGGHAGDVNKADRYVNYEVAESGYEYQQRYIDYAGNLHYDPVKKLPANIFAVQENSYWYQTSDSQADKSKLVSKEDMVYILRQDVRRYLAAFGPPKK